MRTKNFTALIMLAFFFTDISFAGEAIRVGILRFSSGTSEPEHLEEITNALTGVLAGSKLIKIIEREHLDMIGREQRMTLSGLVDPEKAAEVGKLAGCEFIIAGSFEHQQDLTLHARIISASEGEVVLSLFEALRSVNDDEIFAAASRLGYRILESLTEDYAKVIDVQNEYISINKGLSSGVFEGDLYRVYAEGNSVVNFGSSVQLGRSESNLAVIEIVIARENYSTAKIIDGAGKLELILPSDRIELITQEEAKSLITNKSFASKRPDENFISAEEVSRITAEAESGDPEAQWGLGSLYSQGLRIKQSYSQALKWYKKSAEQGNAKAQNNLGCFYLDGTGTEQDYERAFFWFMKAAEQGAAIAQNELGNIYRYGGNYLAGTLQYHMFETDLLRPHDIEINYYQAVKWYRKAAENGYAAAQYNLGMMYHKGYGVRRNIDRACEWYRKAASKGMREASDALKTLESADRELVNDKIIENPFIDYIITH